MEQLKSLKQNLIGQVQAQMCNLAAVDAKELGEVVDMIKDLEECIYYCTIVEAMEGKEKEEKIHHYYYPEEEKMYYHPRREYPYDYREKEMDFDFRDSREGRSPTTRKMYMESKELHHDKAKKMKELEKYMQELTLDIAEMIEDASPEEKQLLHKKISALADKIQTL